MTTIRKWFRDAPDKPNKFQFPKIGPHDYGLEMWAELPEELQQTVVDWVDPRLQPWLDLPYDNGFGTAHVPFFHAWSDLYVYFVHEYDGSTSLQWVPRHPPMR